MPKLNKQQIEAVRNRFWNSVDEALARRAEQEKPANQKAYNIATDNVVSLKLAVANLRHEIVTTLGAHLSATVCPTVEQALLVIGRTCCETGWRTDTYTVEELAKTLNPRWVSKFFSSPAVDDLLGMYASTNETLGKAQTNQQDAEFILRNGSTYKRVRDKAEKVWKDMEFSLMFNNDINKVLNSIDHAVKEALK